VGAGCSNCAYAQIPVTFADGRDGEVRFGLYDVTWVDGGYEWEVRAYSNRLIGDEGAWQFEGCSYRILSFRGWATIGDVTYRMDFDGDTLGVVGPFDLDGRWDYEAGDQPTGCAESITVDFGDPFRFISDF
jgi:hypothetical protein